MRLPTTYPGDSGEPGACRWFAVTLFASALLVLTFVSTLAAQDAGDGAPAKDAAVEAEVEDALGNLPDETADETADGGVKPATVLPDAEINLFKMLIRGGWPMVPIIAMLIVVITFGIERQLGLRRSKVIPEELNREFGRLSHSTSGFDPRKAYRICQQHPSAASTVIRTMLLKIGRPHSEVEHAVSEANDREAGRLYSNVRWLTLAAAVSPLMGLFGTVWGMINAFYAMAKLPEGASKATVLADGIVLALVTTLAGLFVAIPAAIAAHYFEGRIQNLFHEIDEMLFTLLPQVERFEGKMRISREQLGDLQMTPDTPVDAQPVSASTRQMEKSGQARKSGEGAQPRDAANQRQAVKPAVESQK